MKLGKKNEYDNMLLVECEHGMEVGGERTTEELYADGYKDVCEVERPSEAAYCTYEDYGTCYVQVWHEDVPEDFEEGDDESLRAEYRELEGGI